MIQKAVDDAAVLSEPEKSEKEEKPYGHNPFLGEDAKEV